MNTISILNLNLNLKIQVEVKFTIKNLIINLHYVFKLRATPTRTKTR